MLRSNTMATAPQPVRHAAASGPHTGPPSRPCSTAVSHRLGSGPAGPGCPVAPACNDRPGPGLRCARPTRLDRHRDTPRPLHHPGIPEAMAVRLGPRARRPGSGSRSRRTRAGPTVTVTRVGGLSAVGSPAGRGSSRAGRLGPRHPARTHADAPRHRVRVGRSGPTVPVPGGGHTGRSDARRARAGEAYHSRRLV